MNRAPDRYTSIIIASYIPDELRAKTFMTSLDSLIETTENEPVEIIVVDNGGNKAISRHLRELTDQGIIQTYIYNAKNMHFGFGRNQGLAMAHGNYIVIADNDILYYPGWLEACWKPLEEYPLRKIYSTPIEYPTGYLKEKYDQGKLDVDGTEYNLSMRAGSNCFMIRRRDLDKIGQFKIHRIAGSRWTDKAVKLGYLAAVAPEKLIIDLGFRLGYNLHEPLPVKRILRNGEEVFFNQDEFQSISD